VAHPGVAGPRQIAAVLSVWMTTAGRLEELAWPAMEGSSSLVELESVGNSSELLFSSW
jgi:hypothetical protein